MAGSSRLQVVVYYANRSWDTFYQDNPDEIRNLFETFSPPGRVFKERTVLIGEGMRVLAIPGDQITRIEFKGASVPAWGYAQDVQAVQEVAPEQFAMRFDPAAYRAARRHAWANPDTDQYGFTEIHLADGGQYLWEVVTTSKPMLDVDIQPYINSLLNAAALHARTVDNDGAVVINPAHVVRLAFYPGPPLLPAKSWRLEPGTGQ